MENYTKKLVLEDGSQFYGYGFGADKVAVCELVFNTSVVGYQEILSDPSYAGQMVVMTYPLIGNYGITDEDFETKASARIMSGCFTRARAMATLCFCPPERCLIFAFFFS